MKAVESLAKVASFRQLQDNWDGYDGDAPEEATIQNSFSFIEKLPFKYQMMLDENDITPTSFGCINIDWYGNNEREGYVCVEIGNTEIAYFYKLPTEEGAQGNVELTEFYKNGFYVLLGLLEKLHNTRLKAAP